MNIHFQDKVNDQNFLTLDFFGFEHVNDIHYNSYIEIRDPS